MFAKVFKSIFDSSIADDPQVRHLFMDLLVLADQDGVVDMTHAAIAARTHLSKEDVVRWIEALEQLLAFAATWRAIESQAKPRPQPQRAITEADHAKGFFHNTPSEKEHLEAKARHSRRTRRHPQPPP